MSIVQDKSFCTASCCFDFISFCFSGYESIIDWFTIFIYCKSFEGCFPFVVCSEFYFLISRNAVCIKLSFYEFRTDSILVLCVIPVYRYCNVNTFWCVGILKCDCSCFFILGSCDCISFRKSGFFYCVFDYFTSIVFRKVCPCLGPVSICICFYSYVITNVYCFSAFNF